MAVEPNGHNFGTFLWLPGVQNACQRFLLINNFVVEYFVE